MLNVENIGKNDLIGDLIFDMLKEEVITFLVPHAGITDYICLMTGYNNISSDTFYDLYIIIIT